MTNEKLNRCNYLQEEIYEVLEQIRAVGYTQDAAVVARAFELGLSFCGVNIVSPPSLYKTIGKLILDEYQQYLIELETEFNNL